MLTKGRASNRGIKQVRQIESGLGSIEADERKVTQILVNLLTNAVKFTDGGVVTLSARRLEHAVEIAVADTGIGIAREEQALVFEEFRQGGMMKHDAPRARVSASLSPSAWSNSTEVASVCRACWGKGAPQCGKDGVPPLSEISLEPFCTRGYLGSSGTLGAF